MSLTVHESTTTETHVIPCIRVAAVAMNALPGADCKRIKRVIPGESRAGTNISAPHLLDTQ